jgi:hypothetical protein
MIDRSIEIGKGYGTKSKCGKNKAMRISTQMPTAQIMIDQEQLENMEYFNYIRSKIANDARWAREIKYRFAMEKNH